MASNRKLSYIGLTGGIASGKSTVARLFEDLGCYTIDADEISKIVMAKGGTAYQEVIKHFPDVLDENNEIDRKRLKKIVFDNPDKRILLESIVHPEIHKYEKRLVGEIKGKDDKAIIITHAALIIEKGTFKRFDAVILIYVDRDVQIKRLMERDKITMEEANKIISSQMSYEEKVKFADFIIDNSGSLEQTKDEVKRIFNLIKMINYGLKHQKK